MKLGSQESLKRSEQQESSGAEETVKTSSIAELYEPFLTSESFEDTAQALEEVDALRSFRAKLKSSPFGNFHTLVEQTSLMEKLPLSREERQGRKESFLEAAEARAAAMSPRVGDLYMGVVSSLRGQAYTPKFDLIKDRLKNLASTEGGKRSVLDLLSAGDISWKDKTTLVENELEGYLSGCRLLDRREGKEMSDDLRKVVTEERKKAIQETSPVPPPSSEESTPGVDPMERLEKGEKVPSWWTINPPWRAHYREKSFSKWDASTNTWRSEKRVWSRPDIAPLSGNVDRKKGLTDLVLSGKVKTGVWNNIPIPYSHGLHEAMTEKGAIHVRQDQDGGVVFMVEGNGEAGVRITLAPSPDKKFVSQNPEAIEVPEMSSKLSSETEQVLQRIEKIGKGNIARARAIKSFIFRTIEYLKPKTRAEAKKFNSFCRTHPNGFAGAVDEIKKGDCDVVNTYFAALCARLGIPVRHVVGHSVNSKAGIHSGTGHAWSEVWDEIGRQWTRMDATPPGDPNLEDEPQDGEGAIPGEEQEGAEARARTEEQLEQLRQKLAEHKEKLSYTREERELAQAARVELKEARQIVREINEAENMRLPNGERVVDVLSKIFNAIVRERKKVVAEYDGPVSRAEGGGRIQSIVRHYMGALSGESDPVSREKEVEEVKEEKMYGGFDLYIIGDKSGSMTSTADNESLWKTQRRVAYLLFSSLYRFSQKMKGAGIQADRALDIRTQMISFRDNDIESIDADKPLSEKFDAEDKVKMWHSASNIGGGNGDSTALNYVSNQIHEEIAEAGAGERLRVVIACSDGGYVGDEAKMRDLAEELGKTGTIVVGMGLTETANSVREVMHNPPHSFGDSVKDINELPAKVAKYIIMEAVKLFPENVDRDTLRTVEEEIAKLKNI